MYPLPNGSLSSLCTHTYVSSILQFWFYQLDKINRGVTVCPVDSCLRLQLVLGSSCQIVHQSNRCPMVLTPTFSRRLRSSIQRMWGREARALSLWVDVRQRIQGSEPQNTCWTDGRTSMNQWTGGSGPSRVTTVHCGPGKLFSIAKVNSQCCNSVCFTRFNSLTGSWNIQEVGQQPWWQTGL